MAILACLMLLTACGAGGQVAAIIGLEQKQNKPDEFAVVRRASLTLPPDFSLRPPDPHGAQTQDLQTRNQAEQAVFGDEIQERIEANQALAQRQGVSESELAFLKRSGSLEANPNIRQTIEEENAALTQVEADLLDDLLF